MTLESFFLMGAKPLVEDSPTWKLHQLCSGLWTHWSLSVRVTRSTMPFCSGLYGVMNSCCRP